MNLPNKLTLSRIILVPFFVASLLINFPFHTAVALVIFVVATFTDMFDGKIARSRGLVTDFGKFADPLADKILVLSALLCFVQTGWCDCVAVIIVLFREFSVTSIRLVAASKGKVVAANIFGKIKTVTQLVAIIAVLLMQFLLEIFTMTSVFGVETLSLLQCVFTVVSLALIWISTLMAIISGVIYIVQNWQYISEM
ncbi:CDP-diacylglycerol--glycerol-3-phosphate 3-phosphatidyltransferase [uncultured Ruminococcus sp.]|uniref:CDP-diacylglycerol--glycerol-3-phosphate 3-phosphatidyltransferase n=1 Tax=uncultured Ruminococcus sp. TaxID=165186 RepID=UPI0025E86980|nr:CDP-diacylglycerol--glycerol-3-phosphate 3-phosphatidyltransferase [uncultured Ruminococcus sp.]